MKLIKYQKSYLEKLSLYVSVSFSFSIGVTGQNTLRLQASLPGTDVNVHRSSHDGSTTLITGRHDNRHRILSPKLAHYIAICKCVRGHEKTIYKHILPNLATVRRIKEELHNRFNSISEERVKNFKHNSENLMKIG